MHFPLLTTCGFLWVDKKDYTIYCVFYHMDVHTPILTVQASHEPQFGGLTQFGSALAQVLDKCDALSHLVCVLTPPSKVHFPR